MKAAPAVVWFRRDLRLRDHPALAAAAGSGRPVMPLFVLPGEGAARPLGAAARWWLHGSLAALGAGLERLGARLTLLAGPAEETVVRAAAACGAAEVHWNRLHDPPLASRDRAVERALAQAGVAARPHATELLAEPSDIRTSQGGRYKVFTPFYKTWRRTVSVPPEIPAPARLAPAPAIESDSLASWGLRAGGRGGSLAKHWSPGEESALRTLAKFAAAALGRYARDRDLPARPGTSRLSPHLAWGEVGPRQAWRGVGGDGRGDGHQAWIRQLAWRDFNAHLLHDFPAMARKPWQERFEAFPWTGSDQLLQAWQRGRTGFPLVDAGMRQLRAAGWMHNRVRMIAASVLVKDFRVDWRLGEAWFWERLVDADAASNSGNWQWVAGCGADAAPFFRIFSPVRQSERFDRGGDYIRRWVPELASLPAGHLHRPWAAPAKALIRAGVQLGSSYPRPLVDHLAARRNALADYRALPARA